MRTIKETENTHTISVLVDNEPGVLARVIGLFSGRGYNIESLTVAEVRARRQQSRITIVTTGTPMIIEQIKAQLGRLVPVHKVVDLTIDLSEAGGPLNAGTTSSLEVIVSNEGNAVDSVYKVTVTDSCPLLDVGGAEELEGIAIEMGENLTQILNITTSDSHPTKNCVIEISIQSRGDIDAGRSQTADSDESTVSIVEDRGDTSDGDGSSNNDDDDTSNDEDVVSQNWTPIWPGAVIITLLLGALTRRRN